VRPNSRESWPRRAPASLRERPVVARVRGDADAADEARRDLEVALEKARAEWRRVAAERRAQEDELNRLDSGAGQAERAHDVSVAEADAARADVAELEARDVELRARLEAAAPAIAQAESAAADAEERHEAALAAVTTARVEHESHVARLRWRRRSGRGRSPVRRMPAPASRSSSAACVASPLRARPRATWRRHWPLPAPAPARSPSGSSRRPGSSRSCRGARSPAGSPSARSSCARRRRRWVSGARPPRWSSRTPKSGAPS